MKIGMLWFDSNAAVGVEQRVEQAARYYREKYGQAPTLCLMNPQIEGGALPARVGQVELQTLETVLPNHFWIGVKPEPEPAGSANAL
jgi:hypothetical protein